MINVVLLGGGNVAFHLGKAFLKANNVNLVQVYNRSISAIKHLESKTKITDSINNLHDADVYVISVTDAAIKKIVKKINSKAVVVHTSGSVAMQVLAKQEHFGVFYPLQTFSKERNIEFENIPICIEANSKKDLKVLNTLAASISNNIHFISSEQRQQLHTAAVFVNNFTNHLYHLSNIICKKHDVDSSILLPLLEETAAKAIEIPAFDAQTGPARRGDTQIIEKHLENLTESNKEIYKLLSQSIANTYGKKL